MRCLHPTTALQLNGARILIAAEADDKFGNQLMKRITHVLINRLQETQRRLLEKCEEAHVELGVVILES